MEEKEKNGDINNEHKIDLNKNDKENNDDNSKSNGFNWMDKLKPSTKNKLIMNKYQNLTIVNLNKNITSTPNNKNNKTIESNKENPLGISSSSQISNVTKNGINQKNYPITDNSTGKLINNKFDSIKSLHHPNEKKIIKENSRNNLANEIHKLLNNPSYNNQSRCSLSTIMTNNNPIKEQQDFSKVKQGLGLSINISKDSNTSEFDNNKSYLAKWNKCVFENKLSLAELNNINDQSQVILKNNLDNTALSDDLEKINNIMEERIKINLCENGFLKQTYHSIIPFILIQNKEVHRVCLSDYELKFFYKIYNKKKSESERKNPYESYRQGIIKFYKGKYLDAYLYFKNAHIKKETDLNIAKWLAFTSLILLMCSKKIDFKNIKNVKVEANKEEDEVKESGIIFPCCSSRKNELKLKTLQGSNILLQNNFFLNSGGSNNIYAGTIINSYHSNNNNYFNNQSSNVQKISQINLAKEIMKLLKMLINDDKKNIISNQNKNLNNNSTNFNLDSSITTHEEVKTYSHEIEAW